MTAHELHALLQAAPKPVLIHVLPGEVYAAARIPGSVNACVYETAFLDKVKELGIDAAAPVVVYGAGEGSLDAKVAAEKLANAGYGQVRSFEGGIEEWRQAGFDLDGSGEIPGETLPDGKYKVDTAESVIRWTGRNLFNHHHGIVRLAGGEIGVSEGRLVEARFAIDMGTIACEDIADEGMNAMLIAHLRNTDFFDVANHPMAEFVASSAERIHSCTDGTPNHLLRGNFTLRGVTHPLEFSVLAAAKDGGRHLTGQGVLELDRTAFGSLYGSGKLFRFLGQHVVNDHIHLHVKIHAVRAGG